MKRIIKYNDFLLERLLNESILYFSPRLRDKLSSMDDKIATALLDVEEQDLSKDYTFLDINKDDYITYTKMVSAKKKLGDEYIDVTEKPNRNKADMLYSKDDFGLYKTSRESTKIGRLINSILPNKFSAKEIQDFVVAYKTSEIKEESEVFELVSGEDIKKYYDRKNFYENTGTLDGSCMNNKEDEYEGIFNLYTKNEDAVSLLILKKGNKILGRALVWRINTSTKFNFDYFMDMQYTCYKDDVSKFIDYARSEGWAYKTFNEIHKEIHVSYMGLNIKSFMSVSLDESDFNHYPYLDTFVKLDPNENKLYNTPDCGYECYLLDDIDGSYSDGGHSEWNWSEWEDEFLHQDKSFYCDFIQDYLSYENSVY